MIKFFKLIIINILVFILLTILFEILLRISLTAKMCLQNDCNLKYISSIKLRNNFISKYIGISKYDARLGYVISENFDQIINVGDWNDIRLTTDENGFRNNGKKLQRTNNSILAVGDSYTLGEETKDNETWSSCLQDKLNIRVDNAGVFGYGTLQSLIRAKYFLNKFDYSTLIFSILVDNDFNRDTYSYRSGFAKPFLIKNRENISIGKVPDPYLPGTKYNPKKNAVYYLDNYLLIYNLLSTNIDFLPKGNYDSLSIKEKKIPKIDEIINWILDQNSNLSVEKKIILLQYGKNLNSNSVKKERDLIKKIINKYSNLELVDTFDILSKKSQNKKKKIWTSHHTPYGNSLVCEELSKSF